MLKSYAAYLRTHHLPALAEAQMSLLEDGEAPLLRKFRTATVEVRRRQIEQSLALLLQGLEEDRGAAHARGRLEQWVAGALEGVADQPVDISDVFQVYVTQKQVLMRFMDEFTREPTELVTLMRELEAHYAEVHGAAFKLFLTAGEKVASQAARVEAERQAAQHYTAELERLNRKLEEEVVRKQALIDASLDAVVTIDGENRVLEFNPAAERMFGYRRGEILDRDMTDLLVPERFRERHRQGVARFMATGEGPALRKRVEMPALRRDGTEFPAEFVIVDLALHGQVAFSSFIRDLTEHQEAEAARQEIEARRQADELKDQFLSILSHELRTPINAIMGFGSILEEGVAGALSDLQQSYLKKILASSEMLLALVNDLLDMSRIQAGKFSLQPEVVTFPALAADVLTMMSPLVEQKQQNLHNEIPAALPAMEVDAQRIGQVLANLVNNAIKFTPRGGQIWVRARGEGAMLRVEVEDTGEGIAPSALPLLFKRFSQLDSSNTRRANGAGLGLSISKALIEAHGGTIGVESVPQVGSTFYFTLPLGPPQASDQPD